MKISPMVAMSPAARYARALRIFLLLLCAGAVSACGSSSSSTKASGSTQSGGKQKPKGASKPKKKRPPPFEPPSLASLPDQGELEAARLVSVGTSLNKKLCPARRKGASTPGCTCLAVGETSGADPWKDNVASCTDAVDGLRAPLQNLQLLASQESSRRKRGEDPVLTASFRLMFQTRKGWYGANLGTAEQRGGSGYSRTLKLVSMELVDFASSSGPSVLATLEEQVATEEGEESLAPRGMVVACVAVDPKKVGCTEPISLGDARKDGGYQLEALVTEGSLYLRDTNARTPEELKSRAGKYAVVAR